MRWPSIRRRHRAGRHGHLHGRRPGAGEDSLTGLPDRHAFIAAVRHAVGKARQRARTTDPSSPSVVIFDLDGFRETVASLGPAAGDGVLREVAVRLLRSRPPGAVAARMGSDEFAVLLDAGEPHTVAFDLASALEPAVRLGRATVAIGATFGLARWGPGDDDDDLLRHAELALLEAKASGRLVARHDRGEPAVPGRVALLGDLKRAIANGGIEVHFQPKVEPRSGEVTGIEALARWRHPVHGAISPDEFIPLAERSGLIIDLTDSVLDTSLGVLRRSVDAGRPLEVSVNVSARCLDERLVTSVRRALARWRIEPALLKLELTETALMADPDRARAVLEQLAASGVSISIDDFGVGHSSLTYLTALPVSELKVDRSFVRRMVHDSDARVIVRWTIRLGRDLGLDVVAEGVESEQERSLLAALGCVSIQGYLVAPPLPVEQLGLWLDWHPALAGPPDTDRRPTTLAW